MKIVYHLIMTKLKYKKRSYFIDCKLGIGELNPNEEPDVP